MFKKFFPFPEIGRFKRYYAFRKIKDLGREGGREGKFKATKEQNQIYNFSKIVALNSFGIFIPAKSCVEQRARGLTGKKKKKKKKEKRKKNRSVFNFAVAA